MRVVKENGAQAESWEREVAEATFERLDALQARLEQLERERDARVTLLESERHDLVRQSMEARMRLEATDRQLGEAQNMLRLERARARDLEAQAAAARRELVVAHARLEDERARGARDCAEIEARLTRERDQATLLLEEHVVQSAADRQVMLARVEAVQRSRAWRFGHGVMTLGWRLTFHRTHGTNALMRLRQQLTAAPMLPAPEPREGEEPRAP